MEAKPDLHPPPGQAPSTPLRPTYVILQSEINLHQGHRPFSPQEKNLLILLFSVFAICVTLRLIESYVC